MNVNDELMDIEAAGSLRGTGRLGLAGQGALRRLLDAHGKWPRAGLIHGYQGHADDLPADVYIQWQRHCLAAMMRLLRHDGAIFYNHKWRVQAGYSKTGVRSSRVSRSGKLSSGNAMAGSISTPAISFPLTRLST